jgi:outer membrane protein TolC
VVWGEQKLRLNGLQLATSPYQQVAMAFSAPILNRGQINANIEVKTAQEQQALLKYDQVILQAIEQVENSLVAAQQEMQRTQALIASRNQRQNALKHAHSLYREGQTGVLPVLDVERGFLSAELSLVDSQLQNTFNVIQLYTAMGGGWDQLPLPHQLAPSTVSTSSHIGASTP